MLKKIFFTSELLIYLAFIYMDINKINSTAIKYIGILLCLIYAIYTRNMYKSAALAFTSVADLFLLVLDSNYELGVGIFIGAQLSYMYYLGNIDNTDFQAFLGLRVLIFILSGCVLNLSGNYSLLNVLVIFYFSNLVVNCINAFKAKQLLFAIGLLLFVCCDICVGLHNINAANHIATLLMWIFYLPSQVLIVLS